MSKQPLAPQQASSQLRSRRYRFSDGGLRFCIFIECPNRWAFTPTEEQEERAYTQVEGLDELSSECAQTYKAIIQLDSMDEFTPERVLKARLQLEEALSPRQEVARA